MTEPIPSMKRRRLDTAASTLSKPFKSPLRAQAKKQDEIEAQSHTTGDTTKEPGQNDNDSDNKENSQTQTQPPQTPPPKHPTTTPGTAAVLRPFTHQTPSTKGSTPILKHKPKTLSSSSSSSSDPHLSTLQSQHSSFLTQISTLRQELDTARHALKIEETGRDEELEELITKWKAAGRMAAEELYAGARERVNRMGGVGAWKERVEEGRKRREEWGREGVEKGGEEEEVEGSGEGEDGKEKKDEDEDDSFTMDMMLKSLNIELGVIGFDKVNQRWVD